MRGKRNGKKPIGIKKPYGGGGAKRLAGGMGVVGWRIQHNEFTVVTRRGALKTHTLDTSLPTLLQWLVAIGCCFLQRAPVAS